MSYRLEIGLALLLGVAIGIAVWAGRRSERPPAADPRTSTFLSGPDGSKGLHEVLVGLGRPTERLRTRLTSLTPDTAAAEAERRRAPPGLVAILHPPIFLDDDEIESVVAFVRAGGAVLAAGHGGGVTRCAGWEIEPDTFLPDSFAVRMPAGYANLRLPPAGRVLRPRRRRAERPGGLEGLVKRQASASDVCADLERAGRGWKRDTLIAAANGRPVVMRLRYEGGGSITLAADRAWFSNRVWKTTDVPVVAVSWLTARRVAWDEYHQGFGRRGPSLYGVTWDWLRHTPVGWAILQLVAIALVWLALTAVRFGPAVAVIDRRRRSPLEHVDALAAGLESAAGEDTAVQRIVAGLRRRLSRAGGSGPGAIRGDDLDGWLESLELVVRGPRGREAARRLRRLIHPGGKHRVLAAAQAVEDVWEELRPRSTRDAF